MQYDLDLEVDALPLDGEAQIEQDESPCVTSLNDVFRAAAERLRSMGITSSTLELPHCYCDFSRQDACNCGIQEDALRTEWNNLENPGQGY